MIDYHFAPVYGRSPQCVGEFWPHWDEYMHYLYLPVKFPDIPGIRVPERLKFIVPALNFAILSEGALDGRYVYVCARRGYASPGNPLNRPGWHADGFGSDDVNYIWTDRYPTRFAVQTFRNISDDHVRSVEQYTEQVREESIRTYPPGMVLRLDSTVIHATPEIPPPGGERSFFKISFSRSRYNLKGNSHNYLFDYDWKMWDRSELRNDPNYAGGDAGPQ